MFRLFVIAIVGQCLLTMPNLNAQDSPPQIWLSYPALHTQYNFLGGEIDSPSHTNLNTVNRINGYFYDRDGTKLVAVQIQRVDDGKFWFDDRWAGGSAGYTSNPSWVLAETTTATRWHVNNIDLSVPSDYVLRFWTRDQAGNFTSSRDTTVFVIRTEADLTPPTGTMTSPDAFQVTSGNPPAITDIGESIYQGLHGFEFRVTDGRGLGVKTVYSQFKNVNSGEFWNGFAWQSDPAWVEVPRGPTFYRDVYRTQLPVDFDRPGRYLVRMYLVDRGDNVARPEDNPTYVLKVLGDSTPPTVSCSGPNRNYDILANGEVRFFGHTLSPGLHLIKGLARDRDDSLYGSGVDQVRVQVEHRATNEYWNGSTWQVTPIWVNSRVRNFNTTYQSWELNRVELSRPGEYAIRLAGIDASGNYSKANENSKVFLLVEDTN